MGKRDRTDIRIDDKRRRLSKQGRAIPIMRVVYELSGLSFGRWQERSIVFGSRKKEHCT